VRGGERDRHDAEGVRSRSWRLGDRGERRRVAPTRAGAEARRIAAASAVTPKRGGTLRYGGTGGANTDTLEAQNGLTQQDFSRLPQLYEPLVTIGATGNSSMSWPSRSRRTPMQPRGRSRFARTL
jgi:hypothetical protein